MFSPFCVQATAERKTTEATGEQKDEGYCISFFKKKPGDAVLKGSNQSLDVLINGATSI